MKFYAEDSAFQPKTVVLTECFLSVLDDYKCEKCECASSEASIFAGMLCQ